MGTHRWLVGAAMATFATQALANGEHGRRAFDHPHMWGGGFGMIFGGIAMILVFAAIIGLVVVAVRWLGGGPARRAGSERTSLDILEARFARGEIDAPEFEERRRILGG